MAVAHLFRGNHRYESHQPEEAMQDFNKAIEINPAYPTAYLNRSMLYLERNENQKALEDYERYMALIPLRDAKGNLLNSLLSDAHRHRGVVHFRMAQYEKALSDFNAAMKYDILNYDNYLNRALTYMQQKKYDQAIRDFTLCHQSVPNDPDVLNNRGVCHLRLGHLESALEDFNQAIALNDQNPSYYINRAIVYRKMGRLAEARRDEKMRGEKTN